MYSLPSLYLFAETMRNAVISLLFIFMHNAFVNAPRPICFTCVNMGISMAWPSSTILLFKSENTTLQRPMTDVEISLFSSLPACGSLIAHPLVVGCVLDRLGRKRTSILASLLFVIAWSIMAVTTKVELVLTAMFISGFGYPFFLAAVIYLSEISQNSIRGTLISGPNLSCALGMLLSYFLGGALGYHTRLYTYLTFCVIGTLLIAILKESPVSLMVKGREEEAAKSLAFYRNTSSTSKEVISEINTIRRSVNIRSADAQSLAPVTENVTPELETKKMSSWQFFKTSPSTRRQFWLVIVLKTAYVCQGLPIVQVYAEPMFAATVGHVISPNLCSVILGFVSLFSGIIAGFLTDRIGRRPLEINSSIISGICCALLGIQMITDWFPKWTIPLFICVFAVSHTVGTGTVTIVVASEIFLPQIKCLIMMIAAEWLESCQFIGLFLFNLLVESVGLSFVFFFFSFVCFATTVYFYYFLPETKGLPVYAIQELFVNKENKVII